MATNQPTMTIETISPQTARQYLECNVHNRPVTKSRVDAYADSMRNGQWLLTGEPIIFNGACLANGQHRLLACIKSDIAFQTVVVRDVHPDSFAVLDSGLPRQMSHVLATAGIPNSASVAATAMLVLGYSTGKAQQRYKSVSRQEVLKHVQEHENRYTHARRAANAAKMAKFTPSVFGAHAFFAFDHQRFDEFSAGVLSGADLRAGDPRLTLRNWLYSPNNRREQHSKLCALIKAWNAFVEDESLMKIYAYTGGVYPKGRGFFDLQQQGVLCDEHHG